MDMDISASVQFEPPEAADDQADRLPPRGPCSASECLMWAGADIQALHCRGEKFLGHDYTCRLETVLKGGVGLRTDYSGVGGAEEALKHIMLGAQAELGIVPSCHVQRSGDLLTESRQLLCAHTGPTAPRCVHGDMLFRMPPRSRARVEKLLGAYRQKFQDQRRSFVTARTKAAAKASPKLGAKGKVQAKGKVCGKAKAKAKSKGGNAATSKTCRMQTLKEERAHVQELGREFIRKAAKIVFSVPPLKAAFCMKHVDQCPVLPDPDSTTVLLGSLCLFRFFGDAKDWGHCARIRVCVCRDMLFKCCRFSWSRSGLVVDLEKGLADSVGPGRLGDSGHASLGMMRGLDWSDHASPGSVAGVACTDWTKLGKKMGWLGKTSLSFLQWASERRHGQEAFCIVECVESFDAPMMAELFDGIFEMIDLHINPTMFGDPIERARRYMILVNPQQLQWHEAITRHGHQAAFELLFARSQNLTAMDRWRAPPEAVDAHNNDVAAVNGLPPRRSGRAWSFYSAATDSVRRMIDKHEVALSETTGMQKEARLPFICNLTQNPCFMPARRNKHIPTLIRRCLLWSVQQRRVALPFEHLEFQGHAIYEDDSNPFKCSFINALQALSANKVCALAGNTFHLRSVGCALLFVTSCTVPVPALS